jgi:hypothetical protein
MIYRTRGEHANHYTTDAFDLGVSGQNKDHQQMFK